jgi:glutamine synthetase
MGEGSTPLVAVQPAAAGPSPADAGGAIATDRAAVERLVDKHAIELVRFETPDLNGVSRGKSVTADHFWTFVENGLPLVSDIYCWDHECWVATGTGFGEDLTFADLSMRPDLATFAVLPHVHGQARVICDVHYSDGRPVEASPRRVLQRQVEAAAAHGLTARMQAEYEFYLLDEQTRRPPFGGTPITTTLTNQRFPLLQQLVRDLRAFGLSPRTLNHEWGPTQYELTFDAVDGLAAGDDNFTYKTYAKEIASQHGLLLSFMTKPFTGLSGCSSHLHLSLFDGARNVFWDSEANDLTPEFRWAIGGLLAHAAGLNAFLSPTVNCPKRHRKGTYAPASITWGYENRSVAVRVKAGRGDHTHLENRLGSGASNPYLALAVMLVAILDGIRRKLEPPEPLATSAYRLDDLDLLPASLEESLNAFEQDDILRDAIHPEFVKAFLALKRHEVAKAREAVPDYGTQKWQNAVTDWEREQFLLLS